MTTDTDTDADADSASSPSSASHPPPSPSLTSTLKACTAQLAYDLMPYDKLPRWLQDNPYIASGYRVEIGWKNSCHSLCHLHNETMNIWTHVVACAIMLVLLVITIWGMSPHGVDRLNINVVDLSRLRGVQTTQPTELLCPLSPVSTDGAASSILASAYDGNCSADEPYIAAHHSFVSSLEQLFQSPASYLPDSVTEVYNRLQQRLPNLQHLTRTLRQQATSITAYLPASPQAKFLSFLNRVEEHLIALHATVTDVVSMESVARLKALMLENVGGFSPYVTMQKQVDMVRVVRAMMAEYVKTLMDEQEQLMKAGSNHELHSTLDGLLDENGAPLNGDELQTTSRAVYELEREENIGLALRIKRWAGLGEGDIFFAYSSDDDRILPPPSFKHIHRSLQFEERRRRAAWEEDVQLHFYLPRWPLTVFIVSALCCLFLSAWFHCFQAVSERMAVVFQCLDYAGITLLIAGSNVPVIYYGFYCSPGTSQLYNAVICTLSAITFTTTILPYFRDLRFRSLKTYLFLSLGFAGVVPLAHLVLHMGYIHFIVYYLLAMGAFYVVGAIVYLFRIPERWWPGTFDLWFSSHQIWHMMIVAAVLTHYLGLMHLYEWRIRRVCPA